MRAGCEEITNELTTKTNELAKERRVLLASMTKYLEAKDALNRRGAVIQREIAAEINPDGKKKYGSEGIRQAEFTVRTAEDEEFQQLITTRNEAWYEQKEEEITIEHVQNELLNLRFVLSY
jgi:hypothetical protein